MNDLENFSRINELYNEYEHVLDDVVELFEKFETLTYGDFAKYISESVEDFTPTKKNLRICCLAYDYLLTKMIQSVKQDTGIDILHEIEYGLWVSPNSKGAHYVYYNYALDIIKDNILPMIKSSSLKKDFIRFIDLINSGVLTSRME